MNKVILMGRLTRDPEVRWTQGQDQKATARYTLAVDRRIRTENGQNADFISCVSFGKTAEFAEKYFRQGMKIVVTGRIHTGSYTNRDGQKVYTTDVVVEEQEFAENKSVNDGHYNASSTAPATAAGSPANNRTPAELSNGFMNIPDGIDEELPFN